VVERLGFEPAWFPVYPVAQQFAEKLHAYTLPRDVENTRAKDLADMVWLMQTTCSSQRRSSGCRPSSSPTSTGSGWRRLSR
jgi:predicted nucleotidyltransferase component of viral defense system